MNIEATDAALCSLPPCVSALLTVDGYIRGDSSGPLLVRLVQDPCEVKGALADLARLLLVLVHQLLRDATLEEEEVAHQSGLACTHRERDQEESAESRSASSTSNHE